MKAPSLRQLLISFYRTHRWGVIVLVLCAGFVGLCPILNSYFTKLILDGLVAMGSSWTVQVVCAGVGILVCSEGHNLCWRGINYFNYQAAPLVRERATCTLFEQLHRQSHRFFTENLGGSAASHVTTFVDNMERIGSTISVRIIRGGVQLLGALVAMWMVHPIFFASLAVWAAAFTAVSLLYSRKICRLAADKAASQAKVTGKIVDSVANASSVRLYGRVRIELAHLGRSLKQMVLRFRRKEGFLLKFYLVQGLSITALLGFVLYTLICLRQEGRVSIGDFSLILGVCLAVTDNVWKLTEQFDELNDAVGKCRHALHVLYAPVEIEDRAGARRLVVSHGEITFEKVAFGYPGEPLLFSDLSLKIRGGEHVGLVGASGSGKSTLLNLILRNHDLGGGRIVIDGQPVDEVTQESLHQALAVVPQEPTLFHRSLIDNIRFGRPDADGEEVRQVTSAAQVGSFATSLRAGYGTGLGERGLRLSGGQRQRIAIARALLKNAPILLMDEATAQLDPITEQAIQRSLETSAKGKTVLVIAHRLSTLRGMDRILVLDQGCLVEEGTHEELLSLRGHYAQLWETGAGQRKMGNPLEWGHATSVDGSRSFEGLHGV